LTAILLTPAGCAGIVTGVIFARPMKIALVCVLLTVMPLSSVRMVCVNSNGLVAVTGVSPIDATADNSPPADDECARICKRHPAAASQPAAAPAPTIKCLLVADPTCEFLASAAIAVLPAAPALPRADGAAVLETFALDSYLPPSPSQDSPPPRVRA
jgi:hypothetical protein